MGKYQLPHKVITAMSSLMTDRKITGHPCTSENAEAMSDGLDSLSVFTGVTKHSAPYVLYFECMCNAISTLKIQTNKKKNLSVTPLESYYTMSHTVIHKHPTSIA